MNKKKSACLWTIAILMKLLMIRCDMRQFKKQVLHSATSPTSIVSHHFLNYQISKENVQERTVLINQTTIFFLNFTQLPNFIPVASKTKISGWNWYVWPAKTTKDPTANFSVRPSPCATKCNPSNYQWPTFTCDPKKKLRCHPGKSYLCRRRTYTLEPNYYQHSVLEPHPLLPILIISNNEFCSTFCNPQ